MSSAADFTRVWMTGDQVSASELMSRTPSTLPVTGSRMGAPVHANFTSLSLKCSAPTTATEDPASYTVPIPLVPTPSSANAKPLKKSTPSSTRATDVEQSSRSTIRAFASASAMVTGMSSMSSESRSITGRAQRTRRVS